MYQFSPSPAALHLLTAPTPRRRRGRRLPSRQPRPVATDTLLGLADDS